MSNKTNFKRIALVAVAALGLGVLSSVPSQAAPSAAYTSMYDTTNGVQAVGGIATVTLTLDGGYRTTINVTGVGSVAGAAIATADSLVHSQLGTPTSGSWSETSTTGTAITRVVSLQSSTAGTQTITMTPLDANGVPGTAVTKTVTWTATGTLAVASASAKLMDSVNVIAARANGASLVFSQMVDTVVTQRYTAATGTENVAQVAAKFVDGNGNAVSGATVTVVVTGPGLLSASSSNNDTPTSTASSSVRAFTCTTGAAGVCSTAIKSDGSSGKSTITFTSGTVSVSKSVEFYGTASTYTITPLSEVYEAGATSSGTSGIAVVVKDANGIVVGGNTPNIFTTTAAVAIPGTCTATASTSFTSGTSYCSVTGVAAGTTEITIANNSVLSSATKTGKSSIVVGSGVASKIVAAYDKTSYQPGQAGELIFTLTSADGKPVADGTYLIATSATSTNAVYISGQHLANGTGGSTAYATDLGGSSGAGSAGASGLYSLTVGGGQGAGQARYAFYAPGYAQTLTASGTTRSSGTDKLTGGAFAASIKATATVTGGPAAEALAAVNALATTVASLKTLITTLTNLVLKIQKKVKA